MLPGSTQGGEPGVSNQEGISRIKVNNRDTKDTRARARRARGTYHGPKFPQLRKLTHHTNHTYTAHRTHTRNRATDHERTPQRSGTGRRLSLDGEITTGVLLTSAYTCVLAL